LEYQLKTPQAQKWLVTAEVATPHSLKLTLDAGKVSTPVEVPATGPGLTWKTVPLGTIELPAGETRFELKGLPEDWKGLSVRHLWLNPVR
jgi:hypothetical protein